jgi:DNA-binding XRE family transcriptional regulator
MSQTMQLGSGPTGRGDFRSGVEPVDKALGPLAPGENIVWTMDDDTDVDTIVSRVREGAVADFSAHIISDLPVPHTRERRTFLVDLTTTDPAVVDSSAAVIGSTILAVFRSPSVCHWLIHREVFEEVDWAWSVQTVLSVDHNDVTIARADGRAPRNVVAPLTLETGHAVRRPPARAADLGHGIRAARSEYGWSQAELGRRVGVSASAISQMERGRLGLSLETAIEVAEQLGLSFDRLLRGPATDHVVVEERVGIAGVVAPHPHPEAAPVGSRRSNTITAGSTFRPAGAGAGGLTVLIGSGVIQVESRPQRVLARAGDVVRVRRSHGCALTNLGSETATVFTL